MPSPSFPAEIWLQISRLIDDQDAAALCQTSRELFSLFENRVYNGQVTLKEDAVSARRVLALANGPRAHTVKTLRYTPTDPKPVRETEHDGRHSGITHDPSVKLSAEAAEVLRSLAKLPNLESVDVALDDWIRDWPGAPLTLQYDFDEYHGAEDVEPWRVLLAESFRAISVNPGAFHRLCITYLPPVPGYSVFESEAWRDLVGSLKSFELVLIGTPFDGAGCLTVYQEDFVKRIPDFFLNHATGLESLSLRGHEDGFIGHFDDWDPFSWDGVNMPHLKRLELWCAYVDEGIADFLERHLDTLQTVHLERCMAAWFPGWEYFLGRMMARDARKLTDFSIEGWGEGDDAIDGMFTTGITCESYGEVQFNHEDRDEMSEQDQLEERQQKAEVARLWNALQARIARNRVAAGLPPLPDKTLMIPQ
jgi:hypothetical protein